MFIIVGSILTIIALAFCAFLLKRYLTYRKLYNIASMHYKTICISFSLFSGGIINTFLKDEIEKKDAHYYLKTVSSHYDVSIGAIFTIPLIRIHNEDLAKEYFQRTKEECYVKPNIGLNLEFLNFFGKGVAFLREEEWRARKKLLSHVFNFNFVKSKLRSIADITYERIDQMETSVYKKINSENKTEINIDLSLLLQQIFGTVVIKCFFGDMELKPIEGIELFSYFNNLLSKIIERCFKKSSYWGGEFFYKLGLRKIDRDIKRAKRLFKNHAIEMIKTQIETIERNKKANVKNENEREKKEFAGILDMLIDQNKIREKPENNTEHDFYTFEEFVDEFCMFFFAGTDTTSSAITSLLYILTRYPEVEKKVRQEIEEVTGNDMKSLNFENLKKMNYLSCVQKEILRMYSPALGLFLRQADKDHMLGKIPVPKGALISLLNCPTHHNAALYENSLEFKPERWVGYVEEGDDLSYFPFSAGVRNCVGKHLSILESKIAICILLNRYEKMTLDKPDFAFKYTVLYAPEPMKVTLVQSSSKYVYEKEFP